MGTRGRWVATIAVAGVLVVTGCSSSSDTATTPGAPSGSAAPSDGATTAGSTPGAGTTPRPARTATGVVPTVTGPVTGGAKGSPNSAAPPSLLAAADYVEDELLLSGDATS